MNIYKWIFQENFNNLEQEINQTSSGKFVTGLANEFTSFVYNNITNCHAFDEY